MIVTIWLLMLLFGLGVLGVGTVAVSIATRKLWLIPAVGAAVLFSLMGLGLLASIFFVGVSRTARVEALPQLPKVTSSISLPAETVVASQPNLALTGLKINVTWLAIFVVVLLIVSLRSVFGRHHGHGIVRAWPVLVVLGFLALWSLVRINDSYERSKLNIRMSQEAAQASAAQKQFVKQQAIEQMMKSRTEAASRHHSGAKIVSQTPKPPTVANDDILELMDQFDQPRIPVSPELPTPPSHPAPAVAPPAPAPPIAPAPTTVVAIAAGNTAEGTTASLSVETRKADTKKSSTAASQNRKKPKSAKSDSAKPAAQAAAAAKPGQKEATEKASRQVVEGAFVRPINSATRPAWIDQPPKRVGGGMQREVIVTDLWTTEVECERMRDMLLMVKMYEHLGRIGLAPALDLEDAVALRPDGSFFADPKVGLTHSPAYDRVRNYLSALGVTLDYARRETAKDEYLETVDRYSSVGPMLKLYTLVEFSPDVDRELRRRWESRERSAAFKSVGFGAGSLLALLGCVFGVLKIDTWTKGYYTKRLFFGVPAAIIALVVATATWFQYIF